MARRREQGVSLVDVMVGLLVLSVGLLSLAAFLPLAHYVVHGGWQQSQAATLAEGVLERMRVRPYAQITSVNFPNQSTIANYPGYSYTIAFTDNAPIAGTRTVVITVTYPSQSGPVTSTYRTIFNEP